MAIRLPAVEAKQSENIKKFNILVYGIDKTELTAPSQSIVNSNFTVSFENFKTTKRFSDFDAVIVFQGAFERFKLETGYENSYMSHSYDRNELDKRKNEVEVLLSNGGCICYLITGKFVDQAEDKDTSTTDLTKFRLHWSNIRYRNFDTRLTHKTFIADEFRRLLEFYGAASAAFTWNEGIDVRPIVSFGTPISGIVVDRNEYFVPTLLPKNDQNKIQEYFLWLADALTAHHKKIQTDLPQWIEAYRFPHETKLLSELAVHDKRVAEIHNELSPFKRFKLTLIRSNDDLVNEISYLLTVGFGIKNTKIEEFRDDIKLLDDLDVPFCICEVKGINRGVSREFINQTDTHREACGLKADFPALLIANTTIKNARSLIEKDQIVAVEQIRHAKKLGIAIVRTLDLLNLYKLHELGRIDRAGIMTLLRTTTGWLHVTDDEILIEDGND